MQEISLSRKEKKNMPWTMRMGQAKSLTPPRVATKVLNGIGGVKKDEFLRPEET